MDRVPVVSSSIASVGYDDGSETLEVEFTSGSLYQYFDVPRGVFEDLTSGAGSAGEYFNQHVRGIFRYVRV